MTGKGLRYKKAWGWVKILSTMSVDRKRKPSVHPAGKKKKKENVDCDPVVREVVEDTRAAVDDTRGRYDERIE